MIETNLEHRDRTVTMMYAVRHVINRLRLRKSGRGQSMAEFAISLPILLFIVLGFIEVARWFQAYLAVQYAATEAARYAVSGRPPMYDEGDETGCESIKKDDGSYYVMPGEYNDCRVAMIEYMGEQLAGVSLLFDPDVDDITRPYYLGVDVRGSPAFGAAPVHNNAGAARTKIEVTIVYNHPVTNPFFATLLPTIRVIGRVQMVNEPWEGGVAEPPDPMPTATPLPPLDTDGDGWPDVEENEFYKTYPNNPDTDGDGCIEGPSGFDNNSDRALDPSYPDGGCP